MRRRYMPAYAAGLVLVVAAASACGSSATSSSSSPAGAPATSASAGASALTPASITIGLPTNVPSFANSDVAVAQAEGYFAQEGLTVHVDNLSSGVPVTQGVVGGSLDIGATSIEPVVNAAAQGAPVQVIGSYANKLTVEMVTDANIASPAQLRGKRLGIQQVNAFREVMTRMVIEGAGMTTSDVTYVPGSASGYISALKQGTIQSGVLQVEQVDKVLKGDSKLHVLVNYSQADPNYFYGAYIATKSWLASHAGIAERFLTAITQAHRFMYTHKSAVIPIVAKNTGFSDSVISEAYDTLLTQEHVFPVNSGLNATTLTDTIATMKKYKILTGGTAPTASSLLDTGPIDAVLSKLGTQASS
jgi:NitT/TauT family transport system substrate-binding protein